MDKYAWYFQDPRFLREVCFIFLKGVFAFTYRSTYTAAVFRHNARRRHQIPLQTVVSHHVGCWGSELRTSGRAVSALSHSSSDSQALFT